LQLEESRIVSNDIGVGSEQSGPTSVTFKIPSLPSSMNKMYQINYNTRQVFMAPDVRVWKSKAKLFMPVWKIEEDWIYKMSLTFSGNFLFKNGKVRKIDLQNLVKVVIDAVAERYGFDDSRVYNFRCEKVQGDESWVEVMVSKKG